MSAIVIQTNKMSNIFFYEKYITLLIIGQTKHPEMQESQQKRVFLLSTIQSC